MFHVKKVITTRQHDTVTTTLSSLLEFFAHRGDISCAYNDNPDRGRIGNKYNFTRPWLPFTAVCVPSPSLSQHYVGALASRLFHMARGCPPSGLCRLYLRLLSGGPGE